MSRIHSSVVVAAVAIASSFASTSFAVPPSGAPVPSQRKPPQVVAPSQPAFPCTVSLMGAPGPVPTCSINPVSIQAGQTLTITFAFQAANGANATVKMTFKGVAQVSTVHASQTNDLTYDAEYVNGNQQWKGRRSEGDPAYPGGTLRFFTPFGPTTGASTVVHGYAIVLVTKVLFPGETTTAPAMNLRIDF